MDSLSRLIALHPMRATVDFRCHFNAPWHLDEAANHADTAAFHVILEGSAWLEVGSHAALELRAGDVVMLPHGSAHRLRTAETAPAQTARPLQDSPVVQVMINDGTGAFTAVLCGRFLFDAEGPVFLLASLPELVLIRGAEQPDVTAIQGLIGMLRAETDAARPGANAVIMQLAAALFTLIIRAWSEQPDQMPGLFALLAEPRLRKALQTMLTQPGAPLSLDRLAETCNMSRASFARIFRRCSGTTPGDLLMRIRMAQAAQWLARDTRPVGVIGEEAGYQSEAAFNRAFKRCHGLGPGAYRHLKRG